MNVRKNHSSQVGQHSLWCTLRHFAKMSSEQKGEITVAKYVCVWGNGGEAQKLNRIFKGLSYEASD